MSHNEKKVTRTCPFCAAEIPEAAKKCRFCGEWVEDEARVRQPSSVDYFDLYKKRIADEIRESVEKELKKRYAWVGLLVIFLTGGGITLIANNILSGANTNIAVSEAIQKRSVKTLDKIDDAAITLTKIETRLDRVTKNAADFEKQFTEIRTRSDELLASLSVFSKENLSVSQQLVTDVARLNKTVEQLAKLSGTETQEIQVQVRDIDSSLSSIKGDVVRAANRAERSRFPIEIRDFMTTPPIAKELIDELKTRGFTARYFQRGRFDESPEKNEAILVGKEVPPSIAVEVIKAAISKAPFLQYVRFHELHPPSILIGGKTVFAEEAGFRRLSEKDWERLFGASSSAGEFHAVIQGFKK